MNCQIIAARSCNVHPVKVRLAIHHVSHVAAFTEELHYLLSFACHLRPSRFRVGILFQPSENLKSTRFNRRFAAVLIGYFFVRLSARRQARREMNAPAGKLGLYSRVLRSFHVEFGLATGRAAASIVHLAGYQVSCGRDAGCIQVNRSAGAADLTGTRLPDKGQGIVVRIAGRCHDAHPFARMNRGWT